MHKLVPALIAAAAVLGTLAGCSSATTATPGAPAASTPTAPPASTQTSTATPQSAGSAAQLLATLTVRGKAPMSGYDRVGDFGPAWADVDGNGCDTRDDILARDLSDITRSGTCEVESGVLVSPYTGATIDFRRGVQTSDLVQIDHVVPLANAWVSGAQAWTPTQREDLANDPLNLLAVDGSSNEQKSDGDAATWLPANTAFRCDYVARQVAVKAEYRLSVTQPEHDAIARVLASCPSEAVPTSTSPGAGAVVPSAAASASPASPSPSSASNGSVYYANCAAVRAAGKAPLHAGDPGYSRILDRDGDGVACE